MGIILDATIIIDAERQRFDLAGFLKDRVRETVALAAVTASELLHGVERASTAALRDKRSAFVEGILETLPAIPFSIVEARVHARLWAALARKGSMIGAHDLQIAATAVALNFEVATLNSREYKRVPGLTLSDTSKYSSA